MLRHRLLPGLAAVVLMLLGPGDGRAADRAQSRLGELLTRSQVELESLQQDPGRAIPADVLREAKGLIILRETRAGLILGARRGTGVVLFKDQGVWTAPRFLSAREGSVGLQAGWQKATFFHLLMTDAAVAALRAENFRFGVGLRVTSGPRSLGDEAKTKSPGADILVYADTGGLFGGIALEGGSLLVDQKANRAYYGSAFGPLEGTSEAALPTPARALLKLVRRVSGATSHGASP